MATTLIRPFLEWYNRQSGNNYYLETNPSSGFTLVDCNIPGRWLALEIGELLINDDLRARFDYWQTLIPEIDRDFEARGIPSGIAIHLPKFIFQPGDVPEFRKTFVNVVAARLATIEGNNFADIGEYVADKFPAWPRLASMDMIEFHQWGLYGRPDELLVQRMSGEKKLGMFVSPSEILIFDNGKIIANERLKAAKAKGAIKTILLFAGTLPVDAAILRCSLPLLNKDILSGSDEIYFSVRDTFSKIEIK